MVVVTPLLSLWGSLKNAHKTRMGHRNTGTQQTLFNTIYIQRKDYNPLAGPSRLSHPRQVRTTPPKKTMQGGER